MIVCDVVADEPSVTDLVAFSGKGKKPYLHIFIKISNQRK